MENAGFEAALNSRVDDMLDACTKCGACFTACPIAEPGRPGRRRSASAVSGVLDILRLGKGPEESEKWAKACMAQRRVHQGLRLRRQSALPADHGAARHDADARSRASGARRGVTQFRKIGEDVSVLSRLQLSEER